MGRFNPILVVATCFFLVSCGEETPTGFGGDFWTETAVRKVLHVFAYGGQASDAQISTWAEMAPRDAIQQMLTFDEVNPLLSPTVDATAAKGGTLTDLQGFWSSADPLNPTREDIRLRYPTLGTTSQTVSPTNLQYTWVASINKRGLNPFRQKVGLFLTNYHMAVSTHKVIAPLIRRLYDDAMNDLAAGQPFQNVLARGATSAAVAIQYGHYNNTYNNTSSTFRGNDDFAREYHQLFFRILGEDFTQDYHENTTIEHTAWALTGMNVDRDSAAWGGSMNTNDYWLDTIDFTDHVDAENRPLFNIDNHHAANLTVLGSTISGITAQEKMQALSQIAINERESLDKMPEFIVRFFADDNLTSQKLATIRALWRSIDPKNLLTFLQEYAISPSFHSADTYKFRTAFSRNLALHNLNTVDNEEAHLKSTTPLWVIYQQGALPFAPAHDVFGGQTSINAANNPDIFKTAYNLAVKNFWYVAQFYEDYTDSGGAQRWYKDWARAIPTNVAGEYQVNEIGEWLWQRMVADGLKNYGPLERAYVNAFLATGNDLGLALEPGSPDINFTAAQLNVDPYRSALLANEAFTMNLNSADRNLRNYANLKVGLAVDFISMTPFMFAIEAK